MSEERTSIVVEIRSDKYGRRRIHITVPESLDPNIAGDKNYLEKTVRDLRYLIIDELRQNICAETGVHPDDDIDTSDDFDIEEWWFN